MASEIKTRLALLKNRLSRGQFGSQDRQTLTALCADLRESKSPYAQVIMTGLQNALSDAEEGNISSAAREVRLIHNLPTENNKVDTSDEAYFYHIELPEYLEEATDVRRTKSLLRALFKNTRTE